MESKPLNCHRSDDEAAVEFQASPVSVSKTLLSFADAPKPNITSSDFAPMRRPHPRPWYRIAVPGASRIGLRRVWKRVGGIPQSQEGTRFIQGILELRSDGQGPRKTRRTALYVPAWGDAQWAIQLPPASEETEEEWAQALGRSATAHDTEDRTSFRLQAKILTHTVTPGTVASDMADTRHNKVGTSEQPQSRVPQKRNSRRQPLQSDTSTLRTPSASTESPVRLAAIVDDASETTDVSEHITKRTRRRMSRRISVVPQVDDNVLPSPVTTTARSHVFSSPIKRRIAEQSSEPVTPATSAASASSVSAVTPNDLISPSPRASVSNTPLHGKAGSPGAIRPSTMSQTVVFDHHSSSLETESTDKIRRRQHLYNSRRRETLSFGLEQKLLGPVGAVTHNRRRSLLPPNTLPVFQSTSEVLKSNRRHTFQIGARDTFHVPSSQPIETGLPEYGSFLNNSVHRPQNTASGDETSGLDEHTLFKAPFLSQHETVVIDARINPDIFGLGPPVQAHHSPSKSCQVPLKAGHAEESVEHPSSPSSRGNKFSQEVDATAKASIQTADGRAHSMAAIGPTDNDHEKLTMNGDVVGSNDSMDVGAESPDGDTQIATGDNCIVSCGPTSGLDESLLLPLPETIGAEGDNEIEATGDDYGWQSPTSAELERPMNVHDISHTPINPVVIAESLLSPSQIDIDTHFLSQDLDEVDDNDTAEDADCIDDTYDINIEDVQDLGDAADADDLEAEHASYTNKTGGHLSPAPAGEEEVDAEYTVTQPFNMFNVADEDATTTIAADIDAFTEDQQSVHEDSETEMLRKFVTRVKADKSAKAAAAADVPPCQSLAKLQRKRRTGSAGSAAFPTGSPKAKNEIAVILDSPFNLKPRVPFGEKDHNMSPSPKKMKKHAGNKLDNFDENRSCNLLSKPLLDDNSPPRPKRRRRKIEADTDAIFNPEFKAFSSEENSTVTTEPSPGPRRSKRTRSQLAVKTAASTADTTSALSLIPIRLPGSLNLSGEDGYGLSANSLGHRRNDEKELAAATRVNTRKNKGNADPPCIVVARESQKALGVLQSKEEDLLANDMDEDRASNLSEGQSASQREKDAPNKPAKIVRWAEALVRFQTADGEVEDKSAAFAGPVTVKPAVDTGLYIRSAMAGPARASGDVGDCEAPAEILTAEEPEVTSTAASATPCAPHTSCPANASEPKESLIPRRTTRVSRLQPPTPRKLLASAAAAKTAVSAAGPVTAPIAAPTEPAPMGLKALPSGSASARRMAATRAKIVGMGIAGNGTPAPKRRIARMA